MQTCHNRKKVLFSIRTKLSYYKVFDRTVISHRNEKKQIVIDKTVYLEFPILKLSKILMYDFLRHYVKAKISLYMIFTKADDIYKDCRRCWNKIWHFKLWIRMQFHSGTIAKRKKNNWFNERWIRGKTKTKFVGLGAKTYSCLIDDGSEDKKKQKAQKSVTCKENLNLKIIKTL